MDAFGPSDIAAFIVFIGILIFVHELGHFLVAKYFDIKILKFSLGFGPPLLAFKKGETQYQIAAIPLGGFVKMVGDSPLDDIPPEDRARAFTTAPIYQRALIALAGPVFNLVFPVLCFFAYNLLGPTVISPVVGQVEIGTPAREAGLLPGDRVLSVNGQRAWSFERMAELISRRLGQDVRLEVLRDGKPIALDVVPIEDVREDLFGTPERRGKIGVRSGRAGTRIGVDDPAKNKAGFVTGDQVLAVGGHPVTYVEQLESAIAAAAGRTVKASVYRPRPLAAGDLLLADAHEPLELEVPVPAGARGMADLGLAESDMFLRGIVPGGAADRAGLRPGDRIVAVNGKKKVLFVSFVNEMTSAGKKTVRLTVRRGGVEETIDLTSDEVVRRHEVTGKDRPYYDYGIGLGAVPRNMETSHWSSSVPEETERAELPIGEAFVLSFTQTAGIIGTVTLGIVKLFSGDISVDQVGGVIMLFKVAAQAAELGVFAYLSMLAMISVNLGLINLLPIPIFDGGHLLFCAVEAVKRRPISVRARETATIVGLVILIAMVVLALRNDIVRPDSPF